MPNSAFVKYERPLVGRLFALVQRRRRAVAQRVSAGLVREEELAAQPVGGRHLLLEVQRELILLERRRNDREHLTARRNLIRSPGAVEPAGARWHQERTVRQLRLKKRPRNWTDGG